MNWKSVGKHLKNQLLLVAMSIGVAFYFTLELSPLDAEQKLSVEDGLSAVLPYLLFCMLFLEFSKIEPRDLLPRRWIWYCLAFQTVSAVLMTFLLRWNVKPECTAIWHGWLTCALTPTATAVAVMSAKLGGNAASATTYAVLSALFTSAMVPLLFPLAAPGGAEISFFMLFWKICAKIFPVVLVPLILSLSMRRFTPHWHGAVSRLAKDKSFYMWSVCIAVNTAQITRLLFMGLVSGRTMLLYVLFAAALCLAQFALGKVFGAGCNDRISAGQCLGQKNTAIGIWIAMSFLSPESGIIMGAYMLCQNVVNSVEMAFPKLR